MTTIATAAAPDPPPYSASAAHSGLTTPSDYVKLHPAVVLPTVRHVGLLACQLDPLRRTLKSRIVSVTPSAPPPAPVKSGKRVKSTDASAALAATAPSAKGRLMEIELEDTVLFPEGGGQNSDAGTMVVGGHELSVLHVLRQGLRAVHFVAVPVEAESALVEQAEVVLHVDWTRRMDLMTHHTSQHLLSALLDALPEPAETLSWSLTPAPAPCYIEISRNLTPAEIAAVEDRANELIRQGTRVRVEVEDQEGGQGRELTEEERERLRKSSSSIPKDYEKGVVRTIVIDGVDRNPCCGTHLPYLSLLSAMHILPTTTPHTAKTRRLSFLVSDRLTMYTRANSSIIGAVSATIGGAQPATLPDRISALSESSKAADKAVKTLKAELAELVGQGLQSALEPGASTKGLVYRHREAAVEASAGTEFLGSVAAAAFPAPPAETGLSQLLVQSASSPAGHAIHLSGTPSLVAAFGERLKQATLFAGRIRGGGAKGKWQAKLADGSFGPAEQAWVEGELDDLRRGL